MTQTPQSGRNRRADRYAQKPVDMTPAGQARTPRTRQPIGRSAELQARQQQMQADYSAWQPQQIKRTQRAYSDFDQQVVSGAKPVSTQRKKKSKNRHTGLWLAVSVICLMCSGALVAFAAPQWLGLEYDSMPSYAFVNGSVIMKDQDAIDAFNSWRSVLDTGRIYDGVFIDGVHVGGMTREEAAQAVYGVPGGEGSSFAIGVNVGEYTWSIDSGNVPLYRNVDEVVAQAYAIGRGNTDAIRGTGVTPFKQRLNTVQQTLQQPVGLYTVTTYDRETVRSMVDGIAQSINREPVNASVAAFDQSTKRFTFNSDESGVYIDADAIYQEVTQWLDSGVYSGTIRVEPQVVLASVTKAELMNRFGLISSFTTKKTGNTNRTTNIALSAEAINGTTVLPGETFSFNAATGQRTEAKGYRPAAAIAGGETFDEIGGGVCQTSTTLFNAVVRANLTIVTRKPHAWPSDYVPKGEDATVNWPNLDFKFRNDTDWPIFIVARCDKSNKTVTTEIYGMSLGDGATIDLESEVVYTKEPPSETLYVYNPELEYGTEKQTVKPRTGYRVETYKVYYQSGQEVGRELLHTSDYKMYQKTIQHNMPYVYGQ